MKASEFIKEQIEKSGLSVEVVAERTGITRQAIYKYMSGENEPIFCKLQRIIDVLKVSKKDILRLHEK